MAIKLICEILTVGAISWLLVYSKVFEWMRRYVTSLAFLHNRLINRIGAYLANLLECPFCTGFWIACGVQYVLRMNPYGKNGFIGILLWVPGLMIAGGWISLATRWISKNMHTE